MRDRWYKIMEVYSFLVLIKEMGMFLGLSGLVRHDYYQSIFLGGIYLAGIWCTHLPACFSDGVCMVLRPDLYYILRRLCHRHQKRTDLL